MLATKNNYSVQETYREQSLPTAKPAVRHGQRHVSVWNRVSLSLSIVACMAAVWFIAVQGARIDAMNYNIDRLQGQIQKVSATNASLTTQVDQLKSPEHILGAIAKLGATYTNPIQIPASTTH